MRGDDVRALQRALGVTVDGEYGPVTHAAMRERLFELGGDMRRFKRVGATPKQQRVVRGLVKRPKAWKKRAKRRKARMKGPEKALRWARRWIGRTEQPPGSNRGSWGLTQWQASLGEWLVGKAWCGVFVGMALIAGGVKGITWRVASVWNILQDGIKGEHGFSRLVYRRSTGQGSVSAGRLGDVIGLFGESTHVEFVVRRVPGGYETIGGNTSSSNAGSQSNGGGVWPRTRSDRDVAYIVRPRWS